MADKATLQEIESHWTIHDLQDCHEALDYEAKLRAIEAEKLKKGR